MEAKKKALICISFVIFFLMGFTLKINTSADGEIEVIKYVVGEKVSTIEVITHKNLSEITLEAYNANNEMSHFFILHSYIISKKQGFTKNHFYITNKVNGLDDINRLYYINSDNRKIPLTIQEAEPTTEVADITEVVTMLGEVDNKIDKGSVNRLKVMSYNIHHGTNLFGRNTLDEIAEVIKNSDADIIGLQEIDKGVLRSKFQDQIKYLGEKLSMGYVYGYNHNVLGGKYGNGILSKYPIENYENIYLPSGREQRGMLDATINIDGKRINFLVTHLGLNQQERNKQVQSIDKYLDTLANPIVLVGDFNSRSDSEEIRYLSKRLMDTAYIADKDDEPTFDLPLLSGRIDYIFLDTSLNFRSYQTIKNRVSDHYPTIATFDLEE